MFSKYMFKEMNNFEKLKVYFHSNFCLWSNYLDKLKLSKFIFKNYFTSVNCLFMLQVHNDKIYIYHIHTWICTSLQTRRKGNFLGILQ